MKNLINCIGIVSSPINILPFGYLCVCTMQLECQLFTLVTRSDLNHRVEIRSNRYTLTNKTYDRVLFSFSFVAQRKYLCELILDGDDASFTYIFDFMPRPLASLSSGMANRVLSTNALTFLFFFYGSSSDDRDCFFFLNVEPSNSFWLFRRFASGSDFFDSFHFLPSTQLILC